MQWKQAADIFTSFCTRLILYSLPTHRHVAKNGLGSGSFCSWNSFTVVHLNITKKNPLKKNSSSTFDSVTLATEEQFLSWARHTPRARKYSLNENGALCTHGWLYPVNYLLWIRSYKITSVSNSVFLSAWLCFWTLQGEPCLMGVKRIYRKLKPTSRCVMGKTYSVTMTSVPCDCTEADFEWSVFFFL